MCEQAPLADADIKQLCTQVSTSQQHEIAQLNAKLAQLKRWSIASCRSALPR